MEKRRSENQTIQRLCINRKLENFQQLKEWDMRRARKLMIHRKIIDEFDESIQEKLAESNAYIDVVRQFLTDLLTQKIKYELQQVGNPESRIKNNMAGHSIYKNSGKKLGKLYQLTNNYKGYKRLKSILEAGLARMEELLVESQKDIMEMRTRIELKVVEIQNCNDLTLQLCNALVSVFNRDKNSRPFATQQDMYKHEATFIYQTYIQTEIERQLGQEMVSYLEYMEHLQKKKLAMVKEVIGSYLEGIKEEEESEEQLSSLKDILRKQTENKYIDECYSSQELLSKSVLAELCRMQGKHQKEGNLKFVKLFLKKFDYCYFEFINYLILKEYRIFIKTQEQLEEVTLLVTVDAFLNICRTDRQLAITDNSQQNLYQQIDYALKIEPALSMQKEGDISLHVDARKGTRHDQETELKLTLIFANEDQREEFLEFVDKIMK